MQELPSPGKAFLAEPLLVLLRAGHSWDPETREALLFLWLCGFSSFLLQLAFTVPTKSLYLGSLWHHNYTKIARELSEPLLLTLFCCVLTLFLLQLCRNRQCCHSFSWKVEQTRNEFCNSREMPSWECSHLAVPCSHRALALPIAASPSL